MSEARASERKYDNFNRYIPLLLTNNKDPIHYFSDHWMKTSKKRGC